MSDLRQTDQSGCLQALVLSAAAFLTFSFVLALLPYQQYGFVSILAAQPGRFLYRSFYFAGLVVPVALYVSALALRSPRFRLDWLSAAVLSVLPMTSLAAGLRLALSLDIQESRITAWAAAQLGSTIAAWFFLSLTGVLAVVIHQLSRLIRERFGLATELGLTTSYSTTNERKWPDRQDVYDEYADHEYTDHTEEYVEELHDEAVTDDEEIIEDKDAATATSMSTARASLLTPGFNRLVMAAPFRESPVAVEPQSPEIAEAEHYEEPVIEEVDQEKAAEVIHLSFPRPAVAPFVQVSDSEQDHEDNEYHEDHIEIDFEDGSVAEPEVVDMADEADEADEDALESEPEDESEELEAEELEAEELEAEELEAEELEDDVEELEERQREARILEEAPPPKKITKGRYAVPIDGLLDHYENTAVGVVGPESRSAAQALKETLKEFNIDAEVTGIRKGPVITMFEILPAPGVKLAKITSLADNIALRLAAQSVRIVAPIPGKHAVGIEIPNHRRSLVGFGELLHQDAFSKSEAAIPLALGKDIPGDAQIVDLARTPHLLIAGATGSGKSVCVNSIICSILYRRAPEEVRLILIDPKIVELKFYNDIPHLLTPVITDPKRAFQALQYAIYEMERRYSLLDAMGVRDLSSYNRKIKDRNLATAALPYIVIIVDEFADLMATSGKELESTVARLCAMSRAVGIHLVLATQRPSTDVITGLIKANIPSRIAFMVASKVDSRIIIDTGGAEKLLGRGDMLFTSAWDPFPFRMQGAYLTEDEVERVVAHVKTLGEPDYIDDEIFIDDEEGDYIQPELEDPLMEKAVDIVVTANKASASYLQRRLKIGYNRAARLVEEMERMGIVGPQNGSKARDVIGSAADM